MSSLQNCKTAKPNQITILKKIRKKFDKNLVVSFVFCTFAVLLKGNQICGKANEKIFVGLPEKISQPHRKNTNQGRGFKEKENRLQTLLIKTNLWHLK